MADVLFIILAALAGLGGGAAIAGFFIKNKNAKLEEETKEKVKSMLREAEITAESIKKDRILEAKEKYLKLKAEFDEEMNNKKNIIITNENKVKQLQTSFQRTGSGQRKKQNSTAKKKISVHRFILFRSKKKNSIESPISELQIWKKSQDLPAKKQRINWSPC
jgi:ribonucrease Y